MSGDDFMRDAVSRAGDGFAGGVPNDLAGSLEARRARIVRRRTTARVLAGAAAVVVVGALALQFGADDEDAVETIDVPTTPTTVAPTTATSTVATETTAPIETTTPPTTQATTTTQPTATTAPAPTVTPIGPSTPLSLYGIGALRAGMTIAEAEAATGQTFVIDGFENEGGNCYFARVDGLEDLVFLVTSEAGLSGDPRQGVIGRVSITTPGRTTISGITIGATRAQVLETYGDRITESQHAYVTDGSYLDYTSPDPADAGFMVRFEVADGAVRDIHAGRAREAGLIEGCA